MQHSQEPKENAGKKGVAGEKGKTSNNAKLKFKLAREQHVITKPSAVF